MVRVDDFDAFYHATRRPLLHQTYALTGDVGQAATAVEHAFAHAWSEWRRVRRLPDPVAWVRSEAWRGAGGHLPRRRRGSARRLFVNPAESGHGHDLRALGDLPDPQRRAVVLHHLAELPVDRIARELGVSESHAASLLAQGQQGWAHRGASVGTALAGLEDDIGGVRLTRAPSLRRSGEKRHRQQTLIGIVTAAALLVGGGLLIVNDNPTPIDRAAATGDTAGTGGDERPAAPAPTSPPAPPSTPEPFLLDPGALLSATEITGLTGPSSGWTVSSTTDGTTGDPTYAPCQQEPFADPDGNQALLRRYETGEKATGLSVVQVIEESRSERQSAQAFDTMESWYAHCSDDGVQLLDTMAVDNLGDEARAFRLRDTGSRDTQLTVGIVRTGPITTAVVASTKGPEPVPARAVLGRAGVSVTRMCLPVSGDCSSRPEVTAVAPLPTGQYPGFLAGYDLPTISHVTAPWVGTDPQRSRDNPAATPCERANFARQQHPRTRVFVLPTAKQLPRRFGLTESVGTFANRANARAFMQRAYASAASCPDRELSASQPRLRDLPGDHHGRVWRFEFEVNESESVFYRVGLVQSGRRVGLLSMSPSQAYDVSQQEFVDLAVRAGQRLAEAEPERPRGTTDPTNPKPTNPKPTGPEPAGPTPAGESSKPR